MIHYTGNGAYCYANSLHMSLRAAGMDDLPTPGFIECLTTMPFGCFYIDMASPLFFPSGAGVEPDSGLTLAMNALGWACDEANGGEHDSALNRLRAALRTGAVLVGPLDMGHLTHNPEHQHLLGSDHFLLVMEADEEQVLVHDPVWYPYATIPVADFMEAWRGERIAYGRHTYMMRWNFRPLARKTRHQMMDDALPNIKRTLALQTNEPPLSSGVKALEKLASRLRQEVTPDLRGHLLYFALPLGAKRCSDAADFLCQAGHDEVAGYFDQKARLYGATQYPAAQGDWAQVSDIVECMMVLEEKIIAAM
jgi:hypothetical protein